MRTTSAPISTNIIPQNGPGPMPCNSMTFSPDSGPMAVPPIEFLLILPN